MHAATRKRRGQPLLKVVLLLYLASFLFPAFTTLKNEEMYGMQFLVGDLGSGHNLRVKSAWRVEARKTSLPLLAACVANPVLWLALNAGRQQEWLRAAALAAAAFALGLLSVFSLHGKVIKEIHVGCYLWLSSMLLLAFLANLKARYRCAGVGHSAY